MEASVKIQLEIAKLPAELIHKPLKSIQAEMLNRLADLNQPNVGGHSRTLGIHTQKNH